MERLINHDSEAPAVAVTGKARAREKGLARARIPIAATSEKLAGVTVASVVGLLNPPRAIRDPGGASVDILPTLGD